MPSSNGYINQRKVKVIDALQVRDTSNHDTSINLATYGNPRQLTLMLYPTTAGDYHNQAMSVELYLSPINYANTQTKFINALSLPASFGAHMIFVPGAQSSTNLGTMQMQTSSILNALPMDGYVIVRIYAGTAPTAGELNCDATFRW